MRDVGCGTYHTHEHRPGRISQLGGHGSERGRRGTCCGKARSPAPDAGAEIHGARTVRSGRPHLPLRRQARAARAQVEHALDTAGWRWSRRLSLWIDVLVILEETEP